MVGLSFSKDLLVRALGATLHCTEWRCSSFSPNLVLNCSKLQQTAKSCITLRPFCALIFKKITLWIRPWARTGSKANDLWVLVPLASAAIHSVWLWVQDWRVYLFVCGRPQELQQFCHLLPLIIFQVWGGKFLSEHILSSQAKKKAVDSC